MLIYNTIQAQPVKKNVDEYHHLIDSALGESDYEYAWSQAKDLLQINPMDSIGNLRMIPILYSLHHIDDFITQVKKVYPIADSAAQMLAAFSLARESREMTDSAAVWHDRNKVVTEALRLNPNNVYTNVSKSLLLSEEGKFDESIQFIDKAIQNSDIETRPGIQLIKASLYSDFGKKEEAINEFKTLITSYPEFENAYIELSNTYRKYKMYPDALAILEEHGKKFDRVNDDLPKKYYILREMGNKDEACALVEELGSSYSDIMDDASQTLGCSFLLAPLKKDGNSTYEYQVISDDKEYLFTVEKKEGTYAEGNMQMNISMANDDGTILQSTVTMNKAALDTAHEMLNRFSDGMDYKLNTTTTVWVSRSVFDDITKNGKTKINADGTWRTFKLIPYEDDNSYYYGLFTYNEDTEKRLQLLHLMSDDAEHYEIWINNDRENPLIVKMKLDFSVELVKVDE